MDIHTSIFNNILAFQQDPRLALPLLAPIWSSKRRILADVVVCSSSGWAHGVRVAPGTTKIVYCHNPPRWLYQPEDYFIDKSAGVRLAMAALRPMLMEWDQRAARTVDLYIANSSTVAERIKLAYGVKPEVIFPPVSLDVDGAKDAIGNLESPFFLTIGRARGYKGTHLIADAFRSLPDKQLAVVGLAHIENCPPNVRLLGHVSEAQLRWLYSNAIALVSVSREDFGLTPIEANAFGTPCLLLRAGGFLDSTDPGRSGVFIEECSRECILEAVKSFPKDWDKSIILSHSKKFSPNVFREKMRKIIENVSGKSFER